jgi:hypothetical protein
VDNERDYVQRVHVYDSLDSVAVTTIRPANAIRRTIGVVPSYCKTMACRVFTLCDPYHIDR